MDGRKDRIISEDFLINMISDTKDIVTEYKIDGISAILSSTSSIGLTNEVEFYKWMARNYKKSGIFNSAESMKAYLSSSNTKGDWLIRELQGKGYEFDWMTMERTKPQNLFKIYDAGDIPTRPGSDVSELNLLTGGTKEYQMKAYTSDASLELTNTSNDITVITNGEKLAEVNSRGYKGEKFKTSESIKKTNKRRLKKIENNTVNTKYTVKNVSAVVAKAGAMGFLVGVTMETIGLYSRYRDGIITKEEYIKEILKAGANTGITSGVTAGIMIPVSATVTAAGITSLINIPIAFTIGVGIDKIVAPCFGRGEYKELLKEARYYENINLIYRDLTSCLQTYNEQYSKIIIALNEQNVQYRRNRMQSRELDEELDLLYDRIRGKRNE